MYVNINNLYLRYSTLKLKTQRSQKKRYEPKYKKLYKNKNFFNIISPNGGRFEYIYFFLIKKIFKKYARKNFIKSKKRSVFFLVRGNIPLSKKAKNSRMGSGKGYFLRWAIQLKKNGRIIATKNIPAITLRRIVAHWNKSLGLKLDVLGVEFVK